ncbi:hypothetical protein MTO96_039266, partial [Rhipicephalus appendiculatus]
SLAKLRDECGPDWAPSLHLGYEAKPANEGRYNRLKTRRSRSQQQVSAVASVDIPAGTTVDEEPAVPDLELCHSISCQMDLTGNDIEQLQDAAANLQNELTDVKMKLLASKFSEDSLREDDQKVAFYTWFAFLSNVVFIVQPFERSRLALLKECPHTV